MLRAVASSLISPVCEPAILSSSNIFLIQSRGRRRTLTPAPWIPPLFEKKSHVISDENKKLLKKLDVAEKKSMTVCEAKESSSNSMAEIPQSTRRVGLLVRKIGMMPQWTNTGERLLCTLLEVAENNVVNVTSPEEWYKKSIVGKRKAFNREGPMHKVTVGAVNGEAYKFTRAYRQQFKRAGVNVKRHLGSFLVTPDALPEIGSVLDARHFLTGQNVTVTGKSIDWGFQGGMHRWGMRGQPFRRTTKSHRRIGSVGSVGDARIWPGKRMPGHMGYEWVTVSGLQIIRMNAEKQVIYVKGSVPGEVGDILQLKDCLQVEKKITTAPLPTWSPSLSTIPEGDESDEAGKEAFIPNIFRFSSPTIAFTDADAKKTAGRDKTKAKIAKVKK